MMQVFGEKLVRMPLVKMMKDGGAGEGGGEKEATAVAAGAVEGLMMMTHTIVKYTIPAL